MYDQINLSIDWFDSLWENDLQIKIQPYDKLNHCRAHGKHNAMCAHFANRLPPMWKFMELWISLIQFQFIDNDWIGIYLSCLHHLLEREKSPTNSTFIDRLNNFFSHSIVNEWICCHIHLVCTYYIIWIMLITLIVATNPVEIEMHFMQTVQISNSMSVMLLQFTRRIYEIEAH